MLLEGGSYILFNRIETGSDDVFGYKVLHLNNSYGKKKNWQQCKFFLYALLKPFQS